MTTIRQMMAMGGIALGLALIATARAEGPRLMERLDRGVVAVPRDDGAVLVGWRLLGTDREGVAFHLERSIGGGPFDRLTEEPISGATNFLDRPGDRTRAIEYRVCPVVQSVVGEPSKPFRLEPSAGAYLSIPLRTPDGYTPNDASVGDLDGDGEYEIVLHQASRGRDNSQAGVTGEPILEAYRLDGRFLWRINLGRNIREGAHYTQFIVYDLDGDGRAEVACKTADGTTDGEGKVLGDPDADWRNRRGYILDGPEFLTIFDGETGRALATIDYEPARGRVADWGDDYGNRVDRFLAGVAYLDGEHPSLLMCRGYYTRSVIVAWDWREGRLTRHWTFDTDDGHPAYRGQGNHGLSVGDLDRDGRDEILYGACTIDDDGSPLYSTGLGHGDAMQLADIDPACPGLEVFAIQEKVRHPHGANLRDAATGEILWSKPSPDVARGLAADIDPRHPGLECSAFGRGLQGLWDARGEVITDRRPRSCNFAVWWDGDPLRELLDGNRITKWDWAEGREVPLLIADDCAANNGSKATPALSADVLGDWREEVIWRTCDNRELRIYSTPHPTEIRLPTLMHDPQYRLGIAWQNVGYNQPPHPSFNLRDEMASPPQSEIVTPDGSE